MVPVGETDRPVLLFGAFEALKFVPAQLDAFVDDHRKVADCPLTMVALATLFTVKEETTGAGVGLFTTHV